MSILPTQPLAPPLPVGTVQPLDPPARSGDQSFQDGTRERTTPPMSYWQWLRTISAYQAEARAHQAPTTGPEPDGTAPQDQ